MKLSVNVTGAEQVRAMLARLGPALSNQALAETVVKVEDYVRAEAGKHQKTGALNSSIYKARTPDGWEVGHDLQRAPHAVFVLFGTKPHLIRPKNKKASRWPGGGAFTFDKVVRHPGTKPDDWIKRAAARAPLIFAQAVQAHIHKANKG